MDLYPHVYYPDLHKKYAQYSNDRGKELLDSLKSKVDIILNQILKKMKDLNLDMKDQIEQGFKIYDKKPSKSKGVTWSDQEYEHLGFLYVYIKIKSVQRFTEMYNLFVRAHNLGYLTDNRSMCSIGGGPGFELYAAEVFFKENLSLKTIDLSDMWKFSNDVFGIDFIEGSFYDIDLLDSLDCDIIIMSYVIYHYFNLDKSKWHILEHILESKPILVNTRVSNMKLLNYLSNKYNVKSLMGGSNSDYRQAIIFKDLNIGSIDNVELPFYDVPYSL